MARKCATATYGKPSMATHGIMANFLLSHGTTYASSDGTTHGTSSTDGTNSTTATDST